MTWGLRPATEATTRAALRHDLEAARARHERRIEQLECLSVVLLGDPLVLLEEAWCRMAVRLLEQELEALAWA
ncbi:hypothetical protein BH23CHL8_BH23CHL8_26210 [soil metagenome]